MPGATATPSAPPLSRGDGQAGGAGVVTGGASSGGGSGGGGGDEDLCVICLSSPRTAGFLHGASVHRACCRECAALFQPGQPCPLCRQPVERVLGVF